MSLRDTLLQLTPSSYPSFISSQSQVTLLEMAQVAFISLSTQPSTFTVCLRGIFSPADVFRESVESSGAQAHSHTIRFFSSSNHLSLLVILTMMPVDRYRCASDFCPRSCAVCGAM